MSLEAVVDASETSLGRFGTMLPRLRTLQLTGSVVPTIRDLGTVGAPPPPRRRDGRRLTHGAQGLGNLTVLWLGRCGLGDLDGIGALESLEELFLAFNEVRDTAALAMLESLHTLDLEGNIIEDVQQVLLLALCPWYGRQQRRWVGVTGAHDRPAPQPDDADAQRQSHRRLRRAERASCILGPSDGGGPEARDTG